jgi:hypothetical protein
MMLEKVAVVFKKYEHKFNIELHPLKLYLPKSMHDKPLSVLIIDVKTFFYRSLSSPNENKTFDLYASVFT